LNWGDAAKFSNPHSHSKQKRNTKKQHAKTAAATKYHALGKVLELFAHHAVVGNMMECG
jgi:hypothetical protein